MSLSPISNRRLKDCHVDIQRLIELVSTKTPILVICGFRNKQEQDKAFIDKKSTLKWPYSKHNTNPSMAVDICPVPVNFLDIESFKKLSVVVRECAEQLGIKVRWGGDFTRLKDYVHWELR